MHDAVSKILTRRKNDSYQPIQYDCKRLSAPKFIPRVLPWPAAGPADSLAVLENLLKTGNSMTSP